MLGDLNKLKVVELKAELANRGLDTKGVKAVLVDRLKAALEEEGGGVSVPAATSGSEDVKSSQESNDEAEDVPSTPARRGRRATSTKDTLSQEQVPAEPVTEPEEVPSIQRGEDVNTQHEATDAPQPEVFDTPKPEASDAPPVNEWTSSTSKENESVVTLEDNIPEEDSPHSEEQEHPSHPQLSEEVNEDSQFTGADSVQEQSDESSNSKDSSENCSSVQQVVEESQSSNLVEQEESQPPNDDEMKSSTVDGLKPVILEEQAMSEDSGNAVEHKGFQEHSEAENAHDGVDIKVEPPDSSEVKMEDGTVAEVAENVKEEQVEGSRRARKSRFTDNEDAATSGASEVKEEPMDTDAIPTEADPSQVKSEPSNDRIRRRSSSRSPRRSRSPPVRRLEDEPEIDDSAVLLSWYDSDLNMVIEKDDFLSATPMHQQGFGYVWAGARASFGFNKGKVCFEAKCLEACDVSHLEDEPNPHVLRVGWSVQGTSMQLGEENLSYGYGGTGKSSVNCQFKDYGKAYGVGDTVTAYLDMDSEPKILTYSMNGEPQGVAYEISSDVLSGKALFPHILSKNLKFSVNFSGEPAHPIMEGFTLCGNVPLEDRVTGPRRPEKKEDCEIIMMCGLPGCGKTFWANNYAAENSEKLFNILGTNNLIDKMKVMGLPRKKNYSGRWDALIEKCTKCLNKLFEVAGRRRRNYILDQTNVFPSAVRRKMKSFDGFKRRAIVIVPAEDEYQRRVAKREAEEGKDVPESAVLDMKANFKVPEVGEIFSEITYAELPEEEARVIVEKYREEAKQKGHLPQTQQSKRFKSDRTASSGDRRSDDRHSSRESRDYRDRRDYRDNRDSRDYRDRGNNYRPRGDFYGGPGMDRSRSGWQPRGGQGGGWRDRNDGYRGGRSDNRGSWRSGGGRGGMGGGYDRQRGGYNQSRGGYAGGRGGSKGWGYNQGSGGSSWGSWNQQSQQDYSQQWQGQGQGQTSGYSSSWKAYGQQQPSQHQGYGQQPGYSAQSYNSYGNGNSNYNWNQQYYQSYGGWGQQQGGTSATSAVTGTGAASNSAVASSASATYDPYQQWNPVASYGYSTSSGSTAAGTTGSASHGGK